MASVRQRYPWPKEARLRRCSEFSRVYREGARVGGSHMMVICLKAPGMNGPKVGLAVPKSLGKSVVRNRVRRRLREAARLNLGLLEPELAVVIQARKTALEAPFEDLKKEVEKLFRRCGRL